MSKSNDLLQPYTVHICVSVSLLDRMVEAAEDGGATVIHLDLTAVQSRQGLVEHINRLFKFPYPNAGLDGVIDLMSDLEWIPNPRGFFVVIELADAPETVKDDLVSILPAVMDRWRTQQKPFWFAVKQTPEPPDLEAVLERANARLDEFGTLPWATPGTGRVPVHNHNCAETG